MKPAEQIEKLKEMLAKFDVSGNNTKLIKKFEGNMIGKRKYPKQSVARVIPRSCRSERQIYVENNSVTGEPMYDTPAWERY